MIFYIVSIFLIGLMLPATLELFQSESKLARSPFVLALQTAGIPGVNHYMNFICLVAVLSAGNSSIYASARSLMALAQEGKAPKIFARTSKKGVPYPAIAVTVLVSGLSFLGAVVGEGVVFEWLINIIGLTIIITWLMINLTHFRFRKAMAAQGFQVSELPYKAFLFPYGIKN